jgi:hypothetical protein
VADRPGHTYEDSIRYHDAAFIGWLGGLHVDYGDVGLGLEDNLNSPLPPQDRNNFPVLRVFASPQRLAARVADFLVHTGWVQTSGVPLVAEQLREKIREDFQVLPLPLCTVIREDPVERLEDSGPAKIFWKQCFDEANLAYQTQPWPAPYDITYRVIVWSIKRYTQEFCREWFLGQIGKPGASVSETYIPVQHRSPWGEMLQALSLEGQADQSDLEGGSDEARALRTEYSFRLKAWLFRRPQPVLGVDPAAPGYAEGQIGAVQGFSLQEAVFQPGTPLGTTLDPGDFGGNPTLVAEPAISGNHFSFFLIDRAIPTQWSKTGIATVRRGSRSPLGIRPHPTLRITVTGTTDEVLVSNRGAPLDADGLAVMTMAFDYVSDAAVQILAAQKPPGPVATNPFESTYVQALPMNPPWTHGQFFLLMDESTFSFSVTGTGTAAVVDVSQVNIRHIRSPATKTPPDSSTPGAGVTTHAFSGLEERPHLFVAQWSGSPTTGTIDVNGEMYSVDASEQAIGFVAIFTPSPGGAASIVVPDALPTALVYVQRYFGPWDGTAV